MSFQTDLIYRGGFLKDNALLIGVAVRFMDLTIIVLGATIAHYLRFEIITLDYYYKIALLVVLSLAIGLFPAFELYKPWRGKSVWSEIRILMFAWISVSTIVLSLVYFTKAGADFSRLWFGYWVLISTCIFVVSRIFIRIISRWARQKGFNTRNVIIVGAGTLGHRVAINLHQNDWAGINVVGFVDDDETLHGSVVEDIPVLGSTEKLNEFSQAHGESSNLSASKSLNQEDVSSIRVDQVWIALPLSEEEEIRNICSSLDDSAISIIFVPDIFLHGLLNHSVDELAGMPVVDLRSSPISGPASTLKFLEDIVVSLCAILATFPIMIVISILIKLDSPGPILFKQRRYGIDGKEILIWKFRTMSVMEDGKEIKQATRNDERVTKLGSLLRTTSLDELPQFFNVLQGRMSVVGPRPHAVAHNEQYRKIIEHYMWRCKVKPGITGWAQVNGWRGETDTKQKMEKRIEHDLEYLTNWSIWMDLKIILITIVNGFKGKNVF